MEGSYLPLPFTTVLLILINLSSATIEPTDTQFIITTCQTTPYPDLCSTSLSTYAATINGSHQLMAVAALSIAVTQTSSTSSTVASLATSNVLAPREASALSDCIEELGDSVEELQKAVADLKGNDRSWLETDDIRTWVSAALTDEDTCMEGFADEAAMNSDVKVLVRALVMDVAHAASIALSLVTQLKRD